jgi:hypothetical protein
MKHGSQLAGDWIWRLRFVVFVVVAPLARKREIVRSGLAF